MKRLGDRNYTLIAGGARACGTLDPEEIMPFFEEALYLSEVPEIYDFLEWCHQAGRTFGHGNFEDRFTEWKRSLC